MNFLRFVRNYSSSSGYLITTPIYYANASPHLGHLYSSVIADAIFRFQKLTQFNDVNIFSTGTDEHGIKVLQAAASRNSEVSSYCDNVSKSYLELFKASKVDFTDFIRTTEDRHKDSVWKMWQELKSKNAIYKDNYSGWYCVQDETFLTDSQLNVVDGKRFSIESGHPVEWTEEENYMFKLSDYQKEVIYWAKHEDRIVPQKFNKILLDMLEEDIPDISVSRPSHRMSWGIDVPDDSSQKIYVWLDALTNYLTVAGYPNKLKVWPPNLHVIGKDILKFHGIYWPAFLIAAGFEPPKQLLCHSHWTVDGQKMSKSKQNVIDPIERGNIYTVEGMRYFLLREGVAHSDGNYSDKKIVRYLNAELADTFGNLLSRACAKTLNPQQKFPQVHSDHVNELIKLDSCKIMLEKLDELSTVCRKHYENYHFHFVVDTVLAALHTSNNFFETTKPWELKNKDEESTRKLETIISMTMESLRISATILQPIIPDFTNRLLTRLNIPTEQRFWKDTKLYLRNVEHNLKDLENNILFQRIIIKNNEQQEKLKSVKKEKVKKKN